MANSESSAKRQAAHAKFIQAQNAYRARRWERAEQLVHEALVLDESYNRVRFWLAACYVEMNEPHKASHEYQDVLHVDVLLWRP